MPVDPVVKQDLELVKSHFEDQALKGNDDNAPYVAASSSLRGQQDVQSAAIKSAKTYPSYYAKNTDNKRDTKKSFQEECIPCASRLDDLKDLDLNAQLTSELLAFNQNTLNQLTSMLKNTIGPNPVQAYLCEIFLAMNSQCVPDLKRALAALKYLLNDLQNIGLRAVKDGLLQSILALVAGFMFNISFGFDKFGQLITGTLNCVLSDISTQLEKINILSENNEGAAATQIINDTIGESIDRIEFNANIAGNELGKMMYANNNQLAVMNGIIGQVVAVQGVLSILGSLVNIQNLNTENPCGDTNEFARRYFTRLKIPGSRLQIDQDTDDPNDIDITVISDPIVIDNPVVEDILNNAGLDGFFLTDKDGEKVIQAEPTSISLFGCLGKIPKDE